MYVIIAPIQIREGAKEQVLAALVPNAQAAVATEPGCLRFDVIQDAGDENRVWVYEIYVDEAAFNYHTQTDHYRKAIETLGPTAPRAGCKEPPGAASTSGPRMPNGSDRRPQSIATGEEKRCRKRYCKAARWPCRGA